MAPTALRGREAGYQRNAQFHPYVSGSRAAWAPPIAWRPVRSSAWNTSTTSTNFSASDWRLVAVLLDPRHTGVDQGLDFLGRFCGTPGQAAHFARHHGEAAALFVGACRTHRSVESQDVGLKLDTVDYADDVRDIVRGVIDVPHGIDHMRNHFAALTAIE
jgi:hypothetical protein